MHRSRLGVVLIDHPAGPYAASAAFWSAALGQVQASTDPPPADHPFAVLGTIGDGVELALQRLGDDSASRVHLDIETDDVEAETARLVAAGATVTEVNEGHRILADPGGVVLCVVPVQSEDFVAHARVWD